MPDVDRSLYRVPLVLGRETDEVPPGRSRPCGTSRRSVFLSGLPVAMTWSSGSVVSPLAGTASICNRLTIEANCPNRGRGALRPPREHVYAACGWRTLSYRIWESRVPVVPRGVGELGCGRPEPVKRNETVFDRVQ